MRYTELMIITRCMMMDDDDSYMSKKNAST